MSSLDLLYADAAAATHLREEVRALRQFLLAIALEHPDLTVSRGAREDAASRLDQVRVVEHRRTGDYHLVVERR